MKTSLITFFATVAALFSFVPYAKAYDCEVDGIYYSRISATEVEVTNKVFSDQNYAAYTGSITIPASVTYNGKTFSVVSIGDYAFRDCASITSVTIPNTVTAIKSFAFYGCSAMTSVNMPATVTEIGMGAFEGCASLTQMVLPKGIEVIENETFFGCKSLKGIVIPASVTAVGEEAFSRCAALHSSPSTAWQRTHPNASPTPSRRWTAHGARSTSPRVVSPTRTTSSGASSSSKKATRRPRTST